jgi:hypothetical protein
VSQKLPWFPSSNRFNSCRARGRSRSLVSTLELGALQLRVGTSGTPIPLSPDPWPSRSRAGLKIPPKVGTSGTPIPRGPYPLPYRPHPTFFKLHTKILQQPLTQRWAGRQA